ncbi:MAG: aromatic ring-hydroxylating dioxygenase subunit alpha [Acidobacteria bacterium]|nr:aromatic ring-hydroxylating dioxygenase subunit alpha [Acidobacteriota bacterium]MCI0719663.1 aromatic ring-hydroxylating dioxygenase subunit alpha [Acidobacteriota bacterium]
MQSVNREQAGMDVDELMARRRTGFTLEQSFYTDPKIFRVDMDKVFKRYWLYAGHVSQVRHPGDFLTFTIGTDSIIVIRGKDSQLHGMFNVCRHRGSQICLELTGRVQKLVCPYHQWTYDTNGTLIGAKHMPEGFNKLSFSLHPVHVRVLEGLIFVCLNENPPDFDSVIKDIDSQLKPHGLEKAKICHTICYEVKANWKLVMENYKECYHCPGGHPEFCSVTLSHPVMVSAKAWEEQQAHQAERWEYWNSIGIETKLVDFSIDRFHRCCRYVLKKGYLTESLDGKPVAPVMGDLPHHDMGILGVNINPIFSLQACSDYAVTLNMKPVGPNLTLYELNWFVREDAVEGVNYDIDRVTAFWRITTEQDIQLCENNQRGVNSSRYEPGPYSPVELDQVERFVQWYLVALGYPRNKVKGYSHFSGFEAYSSDWA